VARLALPFGDDVLEEAFEAGPERAARAGERDHRGAEERDDLGRRAEDELRVVRVPFRTRTHLPVREGHSERRRQPLVVRERPVDLVVEAAQRHLAGAPDPRCRRLLGDHG
jgi:hypothetical protein